MVLLKAYSCQGMECGHLNVMHFHKHIGNVTIKRCGFVRIGLSCWIKNVTVGVDSKVSCMLKLQSISQSIIALPSDQDVANAMSACMIKVLGKLGIQESYLNIIKTI